jgi:hypothetical protein
MAVMGFESAFLPYQDRAALVAAVKQELGTLGVAPAPQ